MTANPSAPRRYDKEEALALLTEEILSRTLPPGHPLIERVLAERFQLSRTPIREILRRLERDRLVDVRPNQGAFVRTLTPKDMQNLFQLRIALEPVAAGLAAEHRPSDGLHAVRAQYDAAEARDENDPGELVALGQALHDAIAEWTDNDLLLEMYALLRKQTRLVRHMAKKSLELEHRSFREHLALLGAIERRDADAARARMREHLERTGTDMAAWFRTS
ncbi:MAG: GntR family transcriptional regulator [Trueperaceae bacterium]